MPFVLLAITTLRKSRFGRASNSTAPSLSNDYHRVKMDSPTDNRRHQKQFPQRHRDNDTLHSADFWWPLVFLASDVSVQVYLNMVASRRENSRRKFHQFLERAILQNNRGFSSANSSRARR